MWHFEVWIHRDVVSKNVWTQAPKMLFCTIINFFLPKLVLVLTTSQATRRSALFPLYLWIDSRLTEARLKMFQFFTEPVYWCQFSCYCLALPPRQCTVPTHRKSAYSWKWLGYNRFSPPSTSLRNATCCRSGSQTLPDGGGAASFGWDPGCIMTCPCARRL